VSKPTTNRRGTSHKRTAKRPVHAKGQRAARKISTRKSTARGVRTDTPEQPATEEAAAYVEALIQSGQAAPLDSEGKLPAGATHKICEDKAGNVTVVRRRFSIT
jgi:hypothetical protein